MRLGSLTSAHTTFIDNQTPAGQYTLFPQESITSTGARAIVLTVAPTEILDINGIPTPHINPNVYTSSSSLTLEYRRPYGVWDAFTATDPVVNGVSIRSISNLIDMHPNTTTFADAPLAVGESFAEPLSGRTISVVATDPSKAIVSISDPATCIDRRPTVYQTERTIDLSQSLSHQTTIHVLNNYNQICPLVTMTIPTDILVYTVNGNQIMEQVLATRQETFTAGEIKSFKVTIHRDADQPFAPGTYSIFVLVTNQLNQNMSGVMNFCIDYQGTGICSFG